MRRKRRTRYTWLPTVGSANGQTPASDDDFNGKILGTFVVDDSDTQTTGPIPLTFDKPREGQNVDVADNLGEIIQNEYILKRIVGKFFACAGTDNATDPKAVLIGCGFFVARGDDATNNDSPVGGSTVGDIIANYNPLTTDQIREPWIWRRTWVLGQGLNAPTSQQAEDGLGFPVSTAGYGSVADGGHIDSKVARRVGQDDRLWFIAAGKCWNSIAMANGGTTVAMYLDYRLLGALRKARGKSAF